MLEQRNQGRWLWKWNPVSTLRAAEFLLSIGELSSGERRGTEKPSGYQSHQSQWFSCIWKWKKEMYRPQRMSFREKLLYIWELKKGRKGKKAEFLFSRNRFPGMEYHQDVGLQTSQWTYGRNWREAWESRSVQLV